MAGKIKKGPTKSWIVGPLSVAVDSQLLFGRLMPAARLPGGFIVYAGSAELQLCQNFTKHKRLSDSGM